MVILPVTHPDIFEFLTCKEEDSILSHINFSLGVTDLSGLHYDQQKDTLYVISDATNTFWEVTREGKIIRGCAFPGDNQEGLAIDPEGYVYIPQDSGGIIKIKWLRE